MVDVAKTRELFEPLIKRPPLTDQLLQRPPFKFIHDVVNETLHATGFLLDLFTSDELDHTKAGFDKASKISFLEKLVDGLNIDGSLDDVKPSRIVAGKDPEMTNLLLQKLAVEAAAATGATTKKHRSKSKTRSKSKESKEKTKDKEKDKEKEKEKEKKSSKSKSSASDETKPKKSKKSSDKEKDKEKKHRSKSKEKRSTIIEDSAQQPDSSYQTERESSGGTSKGGDDSGIAEETAESERHDHSRASSGIGQSRSSLPPDSGNLQNKNPIEADIIDEKPEEEVLIKRPMTGAARPQTAMGRPGTAAARPAPPKVKKTKIADLDTTAVSQQTTIVDKSIVLMEEDEGAKKEAADDFIVEEEEIIVPTATTGADISELTEGAEHGQLVNRIIENTRKLKDEAGSFLEPNTFYDLSEQRKLRAEIEGVQRALQSTAQSTNPLTRSLDFIVEDFDLMLKEIEDNRKLTAQYQHQIHEKVITDGTEAASMSSKLRVINGEIKEIKGQIARSMAKIIENEKKIQSILNI